MKYEIYFKIFGKKLSLFAISTVRLHYEIPSTANHIWYGLSTRSFGQRARRGWWPMVPHSDLQSLRFSISTFLHFYVSTFLSFYISTFLRFYVSTFLHFFVSTFLRFSVPLTSRTLWLTSQALWLASRLSGWPPRPSGIWMASRPSGFLPGPLTGLQTLRLTSQTL